MYQLNGVCMIWHTTKSNILLRHQGLIKISYDIHSRKVINDNNVNLIKYTCFYPVSYTHLRAHETGRNLVCRLLLEKKKKRQY